LLAIVALGFYFRRASGPPAGRMAGMGETENEKESGWLSWIWNIEIDYEDHLDEKAKLQLSRGQRLLKSGRYLESIPYFDDVLQTFPRQGDALFFRAQALYNVGRFEAAEEDLAAVLRRYPDDLESLVIHADLLFRLGRTEESRASVVRADHMRPKSTYVRRMIARGYRRLGQWQRSWEILDELLKNNPRDAASCHEMALWLATTTEPGRREPIEALRFARRALWEDPNNWEYAQSAAIALAAGGRVREAAELQQYVVDAAPKWAWEECVRLRDEYRTRGVSSRPSGR
jgi:tetratricopeptide (TPR) repeat protein